MSVNISDTPLKWLYEIPKNTYHKFCKNIYSQNGEDGILEQLIKELNIENGTFCEFGASDGIISSNTFNLIKNKNWTGLAIESDISRYNTCVKNYKSYPNIQIENGMVLYDNPGFNLDKWLEKGNLEKNFDILSIDIDCDDYYVWENMIEFNPKIVILEVNSYRDPVFDELPKKCEYKHNIDLLAQQHPGRVGMGCSFISAVKLGLEKNYIPVSFTGNITFVRRDLIEQLKEFPYKLSDNPYDYINLYTHLCMWKNEWYTNNLLCMNMAIGGYYLLTKKKEINIEWLIKRIGEIKKNL
jgi:hypothetical protein